MDEKDVEIARLRAALLQVTEQHEKLCVELTEQYREAERVGWLGPTKAKKLQDKVTELEKLLKAKKG